MEWFCPVCETVNNNYFENVQEYSQMRNLCSICYFKRDDSNWDTHIKMNELIDKYLPRNNLEIPLSYTIVNLIHPREWFIQDTTYNYITRRVKFRNHQIWRKWRRNITYRNFVKIILNNWNKTHTHQIEHQLVLQYLF